MAEPQPSIKSCPICGVAMVRVQTDDNSVLYRCYSCQTEISDHSPKAAMCLPWRDEVWTVQAVSALS